MAYPIPIVIPMISEIPQFFGGNFIYTDMGYAINISAYEYFYIYETWDNEFEIWGQNLRGVSRKVFQAVSDREKALQIIKSLVEIQENKRAS